MKINNNEILPDRVSAQELEKLFCKLIKKVEKKKFAKRNS